MLCLFAKLKKYKLEDITEEYSESNKGLIQGSKSSGKLIRSVLFDEERNYGAVESHTNPLTESGEKKYFQVRDQNKGAHQKC